MRLVRALACVLSGLAVAATAGTLLALAASALRGTPSRPRMGICVGGKFRVERSAGPLGIQPLSAKIFDPKGRLLWERHRAVGTPEKPWPFRAQEPGLYRVVYRHGPESAVLETLATNCTPALRLELNDRGHKLFTVRNARPGMTKTACVRVTYAGNRPARLRLYGRTEGTGLGRYLQLEVVRGWTSLDDDPSCRSFRPDRRNYLGLGPGIVYAGTLAGLPRDFASAPNDATWHYTRTWRRGSSHSYRLVVTLPRTVGNEAEGLVTREAFVWEARPTLRRLRAPAAPAARTRP
jgi:hypothetical protein